MEKIFDITDAFDRFATVAKERGFEITMEWKARVLERLRAYARTINPFNKFIPAMFGAMQDFREKGQIFIYGINPNIKFDDSYAKPRNGRMRSPAYHVKVEPQPKRNGATTAIRKPGWKTLKTAQVHAKDVGKIVEYGLNNFFVYRDYIYGITAKRNVEAAHSTKNIAEMIFDSGAIDNILLECAEEVTK